MTKEQFEQLSIGDYVTGSKPGTVVRVTDINRRRGLVCTGGTWRKRQDVKPTATWQDRLATRLPPVREYRFPVTMLARLGLVQSAIVTTVRRAGEGGYVGTQTSLRLDLRLEVSASTFHAAYKNLNILGLVTMEKIGSSYNRFRVSEEALEHLVGTDC